MAHLEPIQRQLTVYCARSLHQPNEASDVLQSAITVAFRDFDKYSEGTNFRAWLFRYVTLEILNRNRASHRLPKVLTEESPQPASRLDLTSFRLETLLDDPEAVLDHCDDLVARCVWELTPQERNILLLRAIGDFKYREIAEILEIPIGTVMGLLSRARSQLRDRLLQYARERGLLSKGESA